MLAVDAPGSIQRREGSNERHTTSLCAGADGTGYTVDAMRRGASRAATALLALALLTGAAGGCGDDGNADESADAETLATGDAIELAPEAPGGEVTEPAEPGPPEDEAEEEAVSAAEAYVAAVDARDPVAACALLAPGALKAVRGERGDCESDLERLIGRKPPGGAPVWDGTRVENLVSVVAEEERARVTLKVFHRFSDRKNPSVEDDVIYLERHGDDWLVSQADATLYRAVGYPEPPLRAYAPPRG